MNEISCVEFLLWSVFYIGLALLIWFSLGGKWPFILPNRYVEVPVKQRHNVDIATSEQAYFIQPADGFNLDPSGKSAGGKRDSLRMKVKRKIGDILLTEGLITQEILDEALRHQKTSGGNLTQHLLEMGYVTEDELAHCLSSQFGVPYLPLKTYEISADIIDLVPAKVAEKYWILPVDKQGDVLTVVMIDPLDTKAIEELEEVTGLSIVPYVGLISELLVSLQNYYSESPSGKQTKPLPFMVKSQSYTGVERRLATRYKTHIDADISLAEDHILSSVLDVSRGGFAILSDRKIPVGTKITVNIYLPLKVHETPITVQTEVRRCIERDANKFQLGVQTLAIAKQEISLLLKYAMAQSKPVPSA